MIYIFFFVLAVKKSTWYILLKELLTFTVGKPENFVTGFVLLSELLPTPLPIHSLHGLNDTEVNQVKTSLKVTSTELMTPSHTMILQIAYDYTPRHIYHKIQNLMKYLEIMK